MPTVRFEQRVLGNRLIDTVDARDIWRFLELEQPYLEWIRTRIREYGFREGIDFGVFPVAVNESGMYAVSINKARLLLLVETNAKGGRARGYLIDCERKLRMGVRNKIVQVSDLKQYPFDPRRSLERIMWHAQGGRTP